MNDLFNQSIAIGKELGIDTSSLEKQVVEIEKAPLRCCVIGGAGSGKTSVLRLLLGIRSRLTVNAFSRSIPCEVLYADEESAEVNGVKVAPDTLSELKGGDGAVVKIFSNSLFLEKGALLLSELQASGAGADAEDDYQLFLRYGVMDFCIVVIDAFSPVSKYDMITINYARRNKIPTHVLICKAEGLEDSDRAKVLPYISDMVIEDSCVSLYKTSGIDEVKEAISLIRDKISVSSGAAAKVQVRGKLVDACCAAFLRDAEERGCRKLSELKEKQKKVDEVKQAKKTRLRECLDEWSAIQEMLLKARNEAEVACEKQISRREKDMLNSFTYALRKSPDARVFWESDLKMYVEREFRAQSEQLSALLMKNLGLIFQRLQNQVRSKMQSMSADYPTFECDAPESDFTVVCPLEGLTDLKKLRVGLRLFSSATILGTALMLTTVPVAGVMMAVSTLLSFGADWCVGRKNDTMRTELEARLPEVVQLISSRLKLFCMETLQREMRRILEMFAEMRAEWKNKTEKHLNDEATAAKQQYSRELDRCSKIISKIDTLLRPA